MNEECMSGLSEQCTFTATSIFCRLSGEDVPVCPSCRRVEAAEKRSEIDSDNADRDEEFTIFGNYPPGDEPAEDEFGE